MRCLFGTTRWLCYAFAFSLLAAAPRAGAYEVYMGMCFAEQLSDPSRAKEWETVARSIDGVWLNLAGWPKPAESSTTPTLRLIRNNRHGVVPVSVKQYKPEIVFSDPGVQSAAALEKAGVFDWQIVALNGDAASNALKEPFRAEAVQAARVKYAGKKIFVNVRVGDFQSAPPERVMELVDAADGVTFECEPRRFFQKEGSFDAFANVCRFVKVEKKKPLIWLCPNGGMGEKEAYLDELKQVFAKIKGMNALPDIICIIGYGRTHGPLDELPEGEGANYPSTLTGATRWILDQRSSLAPMAPESKEKENE